MNMPTQFTPGLTGTVDDRATVLPFASSLSLPTDTATDSTILAWMADYYHQTFATDVAALDFLKCNACFHADAADVLRLGYANRTLGSALLTTTAGRTLKTRLQTLGVFRQDTGHEHLNGCIIFPLSDCTGNIVQLSGHRLAIAANPRSLSLPGPERGVWNAAGLVVTGDWFLCPTLLDALTLWSHGWHNATSANGLNPDLRALLIERKPTRVVIFHETDATAIAVAETLSNEIAALGVATFRNVLPSGKSINAIAGGAADPLAALQRLLADVTPTTTPAVPILSPEPVRDSAPLALSPLALTVIKHTAEETLLACGDRTYRVRGLSRNSGYETLRISLRIACGSAWHLDTFDLTQAKQRAAFIGAAADETGLKAELLKRDLGRVLLKLEELHEERLLAQVAPEPAVTMSPAERDAAMEFLRAPNLFELIADHAATCGIAGERTNVLIGYLGTVSRLLDRPLAIIVQSSSAAGKTTLMDAILAFVPPESRTKFSAMTGQSLFYMLASDLRHKILAIVEQEGADRASYALKLLQSEGELRLASTGKDQNTGRTETQEHHVQGPTMIFLTTTSHALDEELQNRCLVLTVDESREQTERIHALQREARTEIGLERRVRREELLALHRNAQRLLQPLPVFNPYAASLRFLSDRLRTRRDHEKYLLLIDALALLFQHQRTRKIVAGRECVVATLDDIAQANALAHEILGHGLDDMPPQTRRLLGLIQQMQQAKGKQPWRRRELRDYTGWSDTALKVHVGRLVELEYVITRRDPSHAQGLVYELLYDGDVTAERPHLSGLLDVAELRRTDQTAQNRSGAEGNRSGQKQHRSGSGQATVSTRSAGSQVPENTLFPSEKS